MCGIALYCSEAKEGLDYEKCECNASLQKHRGPDDTRSERCKIGKYEAFMMFHRLMINDLSDLGSQPMHIGDNVTLMCNGEIYNHKYLEQKYGIVPKSRSDCEIIGHLYNKIGFEAMVKELDGLFAIVLIDTDVVYVARDPIGIRPLFFGISDEMFAFTSEMKALMGLGLEITQFKPGHIWRSDTMQYTRYYDNEYGNEIYKGLSQEYITKKIYRLLNEAVKSQCESDRPIGSLLSGIDSTIVTALLVKHNPMTEPIHTFSIGFADGEDLAFARRSAKHLGTIHHEIIMTEQEMLDVIPQVIETIESHDPTTIRASAFMYMLGKFVNEQTSIRVLFSGETIDEQSGSYLYFYRAPSPEEFKQETFKLLDEISYFDALRCDKTISAWGLEIRTPYTNSKFMNFNMRLDPYLKMHSTFGIEKYLLRKAFDNEEKLILEETLTRPKAAFSDASSSRKRAWHQIIEEYVDQLYTNEEFERLASQYEHCPPLSKEALYFRQIYDKKYPGMEKLIPHHWLPNEKWCGKITNPSAWILDLKVNQEN